MKTIARTVMGYRRRRARRVGMRRRLPRNVFGARRHRRLRRGGFLGNILKGIHSVARSVPLVSAGLAATGNPMAAGLARTLGYGRKRRVRKGGFIGSLLKGLMGARRRKRRVRRGGFKRRGAVSFGGFRARGATQWGGLRRVPRRPAVRPHIIRRSGMRRMRRGGSLMSMLQKAHDFAKSHKLASRGISALGYGRRRRVRRRRLGMRKRRVGMRRRRRAYLPNVSYF